MANDCENILEVRGNATGLKSFKLKAKGENTALSIKRLHNMPESVDEYCWLAHNFDVGADIEAELDDSDDKYLAYWFFTADVPPLIWLQKLSAEYPELRFTLDYLFDDVDDFVLKGKADARLGKISDRCKRKVMSQV
jgi:hypothetical protein